MSGKFLDINTSRHQPVIAGESHAERSVPATAGFSDGLRGPSHGDPRASAASCTCSPYTTQRYPLKPGGGARSVSLLVGPPNSCQLTHASRPSK